MFGQPFCHTVSLYKFVYICLYKEIFDQKAGWRSNIPSFSTSKS